MIRSCELTGEEKSLNTEGTKEDSTETTDAQQVILFSSELSVSGFLLCVLCVESFRPVPQLGGARSRRPLTCVA